MSAAMRALCLTAMLAVACPLAAQSQPQAQSESDQAPASTAQPAVSLDRAYRREYAFLAAQKRELEQRLQDAKQSFERDRGTLQERTAALESAALAAGAEAAALADELARAEEAALANADNRDLVAATVEQAGATLGSFGDATVSGYAFAALADGAKLEALFAAAQRTLQALGSMRRVEGRFHRADGSEVDGVLMHWGNIASFGVSETAAGVLAPAGGGRFRLWSVPSEEAVRALERGETPDPLPAFLYENANTAVSEPEAKTVLGEVAKGGLIGWLIVALGVVALLLAALRAVFLKRAGASIGDILDGVTPHVRAGRIDDAIAACKRAKGSAARVVTAALRNLDRDREHLEDIVSESILHESTHLNRFGAMITVIAAVAPLLGLLGTVTGMIQTFDVITEFGTSDPKLLSGGIAVALVTTELGLAVAIPAILLGALLNGWAERIKDGMEGAALRVINLFQDVRVGRAARTAAAA